MTLTPEQLAKLGEHKARMDKALASEQCLLHLIWHLRDTEFFFGDEGSDDVAEILQKYGFIERVKYDPSAHGEVECADPGDEIWHWMPEVLEWKP